MTRDRDRYRRLEAGARRPVGDGALHPDSCPKLTLHGAEFAVPPRGRRIAPVFAPEGVRVSTVGADDWPEAERLLETAVVRPAEPCPQCGRARRAALEVDLQRDVEFLARAFELAGDLLDRQYELTAEQKAELLSFETDELPEWLAQLLRWCRGMPNREPQA